MRPLLFVLANLLAVVVSLCAAELFFSKRETSRRFLAALAGFPIVIYAVQIAIGNLGLLRAEPAVLALLILAVPLALLARRKFAGNLPAETVDPQKQSDEEIAYGWLAAGLLCGLGALAFASTCLQGTSFCGDDLVYHATAPAKWYQDQTLSIAPHYYNGYYAMNAELFALWFILPLGCDGMVWMAGAYWTFLFASATFILVRMQGLKAHVAAMCTALVLAAPLVTGMACTFTACDLAAAALVLSAATMAVPSAAQTSRGARIADAAYAGLLSGLAVGVKSTMATPALVLLAAVFFLPWREVSVWRRMLATVVFAAALVLTGGYWYLRNWIITGNPIFPAALAFFSGPFDTASQRTTKLAYWFFGDGSSMRQRLALALSFTTWPLGLFLISMCGGLLALFRLSRRETCGGSRRHCVAILLAIAVIVLVSYPLTPYSGTTNVPVGGEPARVERRYLMIPFAIGIILAGPFFGAANKRRPLCWALGTLAVLTAFGYCESARTTLIRHYGVVSFVLGAAALVGLNAVARICHAISCRKTAALVVVAAFLIVQTAMLPYHQRLTDSRVLGYLSTNGGVNPTWAALEKLPPGSRIVPMMHRFYPLYGRHFQFRIQPVLADGSPFQPIHQRWKTGLGWWPLVGFGDPLDPSPFVANLLAGHAQPENLPAVESPARSAGTAATGSRKTDVLYVAVARQPVIRYPLEPWPPQYKLLRESPDVRLIAENEFSALFQLKPKGR